MHSRCPLCTISGYYLFDYFVDAREQSRRNFQAKGLRGFHINNEVELSGLSDRQIGRPFAL